MIIGVYVIAATIALFMLAARLHETRDELARVRRQRDAYAHALAARPGGAGGPAGRAGRRMSGARRQAGPHARIQAEALAAALTRKGFTTTVFKTGGHAAHPCVRVTSGRNQHLALTEFIYAAPEDDGEGEWWFWWSSLDRIARLGDIGIAADSIARVLTQFGGIYGQAG